MPKIQKKGHEVFGLVHSQKKVDYAQGGFLEKNKDKLPQPLIEAIDAADPIYLYIFDERKNIDEPRPEPSTDPKLGYLGYKFKKEMTSLMDMLGQCTCNFMRCYKTNELNKRRSWNSKLCLKQLNYLGIMDTIKLRLNAYPERFSFAEFYKYFQDLDGLSQDRGEKFSDLEEKRDTNFKEMAQNVVKTAMPDFTEKDILFGNSSICMMSPFFQKLDRALEQVQKVKRDAIETFMKAYRGYMIATQWNEFRHAKVMAIRNARSMFMSWTSKIEYQKFKKMLRVINKMQMHYRMTCLKRNQRLHKHLSNVAGRCFKFYNVRNIFLRANKLATTLNNIRKKVLVKRFFARLKKARDHMDWVFDFSWNIIMVRFREESALDLQRTLRGYLDRQEAAADLKELFEIKRQLQICRSVKRVQKHARGYLVRSRMDRLKRAASYIEGYVRGRWLRRYFI